MKKHHEGHVTAGWFAAALSRAKRIPSLKRLFEPAPARPLTPREAGREKTRHEGLAQRLAPDATATEDQLQAFIDQQNREYTERLHAKARGG